MRTLDGLGWRYFRRRAGRSTLTLLGVTLGVAALCGVLVANATIERSFARFVTSARGDTDVFVNPVGAVTADMPAEVAERVARLPAVKHFRAVARAPAELTNVSPAVPPPSGKTVTFGLSSERGIVVLVGLSPLPTGDPFPVGTLVAGRTVADGADEVVTSAGFADFPPPYSITVDTPTGLHDLAVVGTMRGERLEPDDIVVFSTSLATAQRLRGNTNLSAVAIMLDDGVDVREWTAAHRHAVGPGVEMVESGAFTAGLENSIDVVSGSFTALAGISLFVGAFLIYLTLSTTVVERTRDLGTLRALGATRRQVQRTVVAEAMVSGSLAAVAGIVLGITLATVMVRFLTVLTDLETQAVVIPAVSIVISLTAGLVTVFVGSAWPARRASAMEPVAAMRGPEASIGARISRAWIGGIVLVGAGVVCAAFVPGMVVIAVGNVLILVGAVLIVPALVPPLAALARAVSRGRAGTIGDIAVLHVARERTRSAYTLGLVMVVLAMTFAIGASNLSTRAALDRVLDTQFGADLEVASAVPFPDEFEAGLRGVVGVASVTSYRYGRSRATGPRGEGPVSIIGIDETSYFTVASFPWIAGSDDEAERALAARGSVLLPERFAVDYGVGRGDVLHVETGSGRRGFTVAGVFASVLQTPQRIGVVVGRADARESFRMERVNAYDIWVVAGHADIAVQQRIEEQLGPRQPISVNLTSGLKRYVRQQFQGFYTLFYAVFFVAGLVSVLALANTLTVSVVRRFREIGVLRSIGALPGQVRRMVLLESLVLSVTALVLSVPLGILLSRLIVDRTSETIRFSTVYRFPWVFLPIVALVALVVAVVASIIPARRASRLDPVDALRYD